MINLNERGNLMRKEVKVKLDIPEGYQVYDYRNPRPNEIILEDGNVVKVMESSPMLHQDMFILRKIIQWVPGMQFTLPDSDSRFLIICESKNNVAIVHIQSGSICDKIHETKLNALMNDKYYYAEVLTLNK